MFSKQSGQILSWCNLFLLLIFLSSGCSPSRVIVSSPPSRDMPSPQPGTSKDTKDLSPRPAPRAIASLQLTEQARVLLQQDRSDDAISLLERAISLNPSDGRNYYYMAEAWLHKRNMAQAREFNRLAEIYLEENDDWIVKTSRQKERIRGALP